MAYTGGRPVSGPLPFHQGKNTLAAEARGWLERSPRVAVTVLVWAVGIAAAWAPIILALRLIGVL